jgi:hypothetical protein
LKSTVRFFFHSDYPKFYNFERRSTIPSIYKSILPREDYYIANLAVKAAVTISNAIREEIEIIQQQWKRMESFSLIRFHPDTGQFRSLSGSLSAEVASIARSLLNQVQTHYRRGDDEFISAVEAYIRVIPMRSAAKLNAHELLGSRLKLSQQTELLDTLERCLSQVDRIRALIQSTVSVYFPSRKPSKYRLSAGSLIRLFKSFVG